VRWRTDRCCSISGYVRHPAEVASLCTDNACVTTQYLFSEPLQSSHREIIMKTKFSKKQLAVACALALGIVSGTAIAQSSPQTLAPVLGPVNEHALVTTTQGQVWVNSFGDCWHSGFGPTPAPNFPCGPQPIAQYVAPYVAPAPAPYVAPYVAPAPIFVAAAAPQPVYEKVTLDADTLFDFDKSVLRPAGRDALDSFMKKIQGIDPSTIVAVGHTDRLGTDRYNQSLSERRVASVKTYLVSKGIASNQVHTSGKGESQPVTKAGQCPGGKNAKLIACLQPDRRVELEVSGSRLIKQ
jgi:OOP family OmpA-OmpF porin